MDTVYLIVMILSSTYIASVDMMTTTLCHGWWLTLTCPWPSRLQIERATFLQSHDGCQRLQGLTSTKLPKHNCSSLIAHGEASLRCNGRLNCSLTTEIIFPNGCGLNSNVVTEIEASCTQKDWRHVVSNHSTFHYSITRKFDDSADEINFCPETVRDGVYWMKTHSGQVRTSHCRDGGKGVSSWKCLPSSVWDPTGPDWSRCHAGQTTLEQHIREANNAGDVHLASQRLSVMTEQMENMTGSEISQISNILRDIVDTAISSIDSRQNESLDRWLLMNKGIVKTVSNLLNGNLDVPWRSLAQRKSDLIGNEIMSSVEKGAFLMHMENVSSIEIREDNVFLSVDIGARGGHHSEKDLLFPSAKSMAEFAINDSLTISSNELHRTDSDGTSKLVFVVYNNLAQFLGSSSDESYSVNSRILSASIELPGQKRNLTTPATIVLQHIKPSDAEHACVFWDYDQTGSQRWSKEGCVVKSNNFTHTTCSCTHLTSFALLVNHQGFEDATHENTLTCLTWIGLPLSLICLALSIATFVYFRALQSIRTSIHTNLCICLFVSQLTFLVGIDLPHLPTACSLIAGVLHYFLLATFTWMALEGVQLYVMLIEVFEKQTRIVFYYIAGYGFPAVFVSVSAGLYPSGYGTESSCWLSTGNSTGQVSPLIWSFIAPASFVALANLGFVILTASMMYKHGRKYIFFSRIKAIKGALKGTVALVCLLGTTWILGLLWWWEGMAALQYLFTIFNAFQGVYIFIFHCLLHNKVRCEYRKLFSRCRGGNYSGMTNTSSMKVKFRSSKKSSSDRFKNKRTSSRREGSQRQSYNDDVDKRSTDDLGSVQNLRDASKFFSTQDRASMKILFAKKENPDTRNRVNFTNEPDSNFQTRSLSTRSCPGKDAPNRKRASSGTRDESPFKRSMSERRHHRAKYNTPVSEGVSRILKSAASSHSIVPCQYLPAKAWQDRSPGSTCTRTTTLSKDTSTLSRYHVPSSPPAGPNSPTKEFKLVDKRLAKLQKMNSSPSLRLGRTCSLNGVKKRELNRRLEDQPSSSVPDLMSQLSEKIESRDISVVLLNYLDEDGTLNQEKLEEARRFDNL